MFNMEEEYSKDPTMYEDAKAYGMIYLKKLLIRALIIIFVVIGVHKFFQYEKSIYTTVDGATITINKSILRPDLFLTNNFLQKFMDNSPDCEDADKLYDLSIGNSCSFKSNKKNIYIKIIKNDVFLISKKEDLKIQLCKNKVSCNTTFSHDDLYLTTPRGF